MKKVYETPMAYVEEFSVNRAIAACEQKDVVFDCMMGPQTDTTNVITDSCRNKAGATTATIATHNATRRSGHSDGTGGSWSGGNRSSLTYTAPEGAVGLLYICSDGRHNFSKDKWSNSNGRLVHSNSHTGSYHCQIAPIYNQSDVVMGS